MLNNLGSWDIQVERRGYSSKVILLADHGYFMPENVTPQAQVIIEEGEKGQAQGRTSFVQQYPLIKKGIYCICQISHI